MHIASIKSLGVKFSLAITAAGAILLAGPTPAQAQHFSAGFKYGAPAYVPYGTPAYAADRDHYLDRAFYARERAEREALERRQREEFLRRERWEREHRYSYYR